MEPNDDLPRGSPLQDHGPWHKGHFLNMDNPGKGTLAHDLQVINILAEPTVGNRRRWYKRRDPEGYQRLVEENNGEEPNLDPTPRQSAQYTTMALQELFSRGKSHMSDFNAREKESAKDYYASKKLLQDKLEQLNLRKSAAQQKFAGQKLSAINPQKVPPSRASIVEKEERRAVSEQSTSFASGDQPPPSGSSSSTLSMKSRCPCTEKRTLTFQVLPLHRVRSLRHHYP